MDRAALEAERTDLERQRRKRVESSSPHEAVIAMIDKRLGEIKTLLGGE